MFQFALLLQISLQELQSVLVILEAIALIEQIGWPGHKDFPVSFTIQLPCKELSLAHRPEVSHQQVIKLVGLEPTLLGETLPFEVDHFVDLKFLQVGVHLHFDSI